MDKTSLHILRIASSHDKPLTLRKVEKLTKISMDDIASAIEALFDLEYLYSDVRDTILNTYDERFTFHISQKGKNVLAGYKRDIFHKKASMVISIIALVVAIISILISAYTAFINA